MPTYRHLSGKRFLFVHIPRTAGRFLEQNIKLNDFQVEHKMWNTIDGIEVAHFHAELYEKHLRVYGIPHIAIIRNPIDRFFSSSPFIKTMYGDDIQEAMEDEMLFFSMLDNFPLSQSVNWFRPQVDFITENTNLWKFEDGFGGDFDVWMSNVLDVPFKIREVEYERLEFTDESNKLKRTPKLIENIKKLCKKDFETFYPELI